MKKFEELVFSDDYIFKIVMEEKDVFKAVLKAVLPQLEVESLVSLETEKPYTLGYFLHGVRFDVVAKGGKNVINIEMQILDEGDTAERSLYYLALLIVLSLEKGKKYKQIPECCVIFFCKFDPMKQGLPIYTFDIKCEEQKGLTLTSKAKIILLNAPAWKKCESGELKELLKFITTNKAQGDVARLVAETVKDKKAKEITKGGWGMLEDELRRERKEGEREGKRKGERKGERKKALETASNFIKMGVLTFEQIASGTGLPVEEVAALHQRLSATL